MTRDSLCSLFVLLIAAIGVPSVAAQQGPATPPEQRAVKDGKQLVDVDCSACKGTGKTRVPEAQEPCERCKGTGWYPPGKSLRERCGQDKFAKAFGDKGCGGSGQITKPAHDESCAACEGKGKVKKAIDNPLIKRQAGQPPKALTFEDLPSIDWTAGLQGEKKLRWGMSQQEVEEALGTRLHLENESSGITTYSTSATTTWEGKRVSLDHWSIQFVRGQFYSIDLKVVPGDEDQLLVAVFQRMGSARFSEERLDMPRSGGEVLKAPKRRTEKPSVPANQNPPERWYQWVDRDTEVLGWDSYGYNNATRQNERSVVLMLRGWRFAADTVPKDHGAVYGESAKCFLEWANANRYGR